jgi:hypothetical protein
MTLRAPSYDLGRRIGRACNASAPGSNLPFHEDQIVFIVVAVIVASGIGSPKAMLVVE